MKQRPILFSTPMVQAILDGRKTVTRRMVRFPYSNDALKFDCSTNRITWAGFNGNTQITPWQDCQYGKPGDVLWVRETFAPYVIDNYDDKGNDKYTWLFKADGQESQWILDGMEDATWKPSIHMPKAACRIFLEVVSVKVERLQDITEGDCVREGIKKESENGYPSALPQFEHLWQLINGSDSWDANPWVWVVEFKRIEKPYSATF